MERLEDRRGYASGKTRPQAPGDGGGGPQGGGSRTRTSCYPLTTDVLRLNIVAVVTSLAIHLLVQ